MFFWEVFTSFFIILRVFELFALSFQNFLLNFFFNFLFVMANLSIFLTTIWVDFLGVRFEVERGGITPCLKLIRVMLKPKNFALRKYTVQYQGPLNFADVNNFLQKVSVFWPKLYFYSNQQCENCVRDFLVLFSVFVRQFTINENVSFTYYASRIWFLDYSKLPANWKNGNYVTIFDKTSSAIFF